MKAITVTSYVREVEVKYKKFSDVPPDLMKISNSRDLYLLFRDRMTAEPVEVFYSLLLNSKNKIMCIDLISRGCLSSSVVHPREVFSNAVMKHAAALILMHNHPSGDPAPSKEDSDCTIRLVKAGQILGICVLDHIIVGTSDYYSFADNGLLEIAA